MRQSRRMNGCLTGKRLHLTKGVDLVVPHHHLPLKQTIHFDVPDGDSPRIRNENGVIFDIPRRLPEDFSSEEYGVDGFFPFGDDSGSKKWEFVSLSVTANAPLLQNLFHPRT